MNVLAELNLVTPISSRFLGVVPISEIAPPNPTLVGTEILMRHK